jgi:probable rRNA maturation factor
MEVMIVIEFENETPYQFDFDINDLAEKVINKSLDYIKCPFEVSLCLTITDNKEIKRINKEFRDIDKETDVLSFPMLSYEKPGDFEFLDNDDSISYEFFDPDSGELILGDIIISYEKALEQAEEYNHSLKREIAFLIAHSMLHLFGFDHMEDDERELMENMQNEILLELGISRQE